jgi:hypothetical protein
MQVLAVAFVLIALIALALLISVVVLVVVAMRRPQGEHAMSEAQYAKDARRLVTEIQGILASSPLPPEQRAELLRQLNQVPQNITHALGKLGRLRRVKKIAQRSEGAGAVLQELAHLEAQIVAELRSAHQTLLAAPVALMKLDLARGDRDFQRMVAALDEANQRLRDLAESYEALRTRRAWESLG